jgi:hypothetical protein
VCPKSIKEYEPGVFYCNLCERPVVGIKKIGWLWLIVLGILTVGIFVVFFYLPYYLLVKEKQCPICFNTLSGLTQEERLARDRKARAPLTGYIGSLRWGTAGLFLPVVAPIAVIKSIKTMKEEEEDISKNKRMIPLILGVVGSIELIFLIVWLSTADWTK